MNKQLQFITKSPGVIEVCSTRKDIIEPKDTQCLIVRARGLDKTDVKMWTVLDIGQFLPSNNAGNKIPLITGDYQSCKQKAIDHYANA